MTRIEYEFRYRRKGKDTFQVETQKTVKLLITTLTLMIIVLSAVFLILTNESSQKGYALEQAKLKNEHLKSLSASLENKIVKSTSSENLENKDKIEEMEELQQKTYVTEEDNMVK